MEQESISDANNVTADAFSRAPSVQRENASAIFKSEKLDKLDELVDAVNNLTINYSKYYESNTATASDAQGNLTSDPETVTHTINGLFNKNYRVAGLQYTCAAPANKPGDCGNYIDATDARDACDEGNLFRHSVERHVDVQDSAASQWDWCRWEHPRRHWQF